jgi:hypothetical protein
MPGGEGLRRLRVVVALVSVLSVPTAWIVGVAPSYDSVGELVDDMAIFLVVLTAIAAVPCVVYAVAVRGRAVTLVTGSLLVFLDVVVHALSAAVHAWGDPGGAGGMLFWFCLPAVALTYPIALLAVVFDGVRRDRGQGLAAAESLMREWATRDVGRTGAVAGGPPSFRAATGDHTVGSFRGPLDGHDHGQGHSQGHGPGHADGGQRSTWERPE